MVYMHFPTHLTEEEEMLQRKYAKLKKKKRAIAQLRAPKPDPPPAVADKRPHEAAADATEQAKKLIKLGAIRVEAEKKDNQTFKRSKRQKETEKTSAAVAFQPYPAESEREDEPRSESSRGKVRSLYDSFVSSRESRYDREDRHERPDEREPRRRDRERDRERDRDLGAPRKGNTIYVFGAGVTEDLLRKAFSNFGNILNISMELEKNCGFVTFEKMESADQAIVQMNGCMVSGVHLKVTLARRQPTFEANTDPSNSSLWASIAASNSPKGAHKDSRNLVAYDDNELF